MMKTKILHNDEKNTVHNDESKTVHNVEKIVHNYENKHCT